MIYLVEDIREKCHAHNLKPVLKERFAAVTFLFIFRIPVHGWSVSNNAWHGWRCCDVNAKLGYCYHPKASIFPITAYSEFYFFYTTAISQQ